MKKLLYILSALVLAGCTVSEIGDDTVELRSNGVVYTAGFEDVDTKVYVDTDLKTHWTEGDKISIFTSTYNEEYKFDGQTGDTEGSFTVVDDKFHTGASVPTTYAVYPYFEGTSITSEGVITLNLPAVQNYAENSYGLGVNTMVAATESKSSKALNFKSLCGYIVVRLYGEGTVKSITLTGNNGEKLAGIATVAPVYGQAPVVTMSESATTRIILDCGEGVVLGKTVENATAFWFAVPPVTFSQGFTIKVTNTDLWSMEKTMKVKRTVVRNIKNPLAPLEVDFNIPREGNIEFEDANFKAYCVQNFDTNGDGELSFEEALNITHIIVKTDNITSLIGIEHFINLIHLSCFGSGIIWNKEKQTYIRSGQLKALDVSHNTALATLNCYNNQLTELDVSNNTALSTLSCYSNELTALDVSNNTVLTELRCDSNPLTALDVSNNTMLTLLFCLSNQLTALDVSNNTVLTELMCSSNQLTSLDVSNNTALERLYCDNNQLTSLDVSSNAALERLWCYNNPNLNEIWLMKGQTIAGFQYDTDVATIKYRGVDDVVAFEDANFKAYCVENFDTNGDGEISYEEAATVTTIQCNGRFITSLGGIQYFTAMTTLYCSDNQLTSLNVMGNTLLQYLDCQDNQLSALDISGCSSLIKVKCYSNQLASLNVSGCLALKSLGCYENTLTSLDVSENTELKELFCNSNLLTSLDVSKNAALKSLICNSNQLTTLDVSNNPVLGELSCISNPQLTEIWLQRGQTIEHLQYDENVSTIKYRGEDEESITYFEDDFEWFEPWSIAVGAGDDVGDNYVNTSTSPNLLTNEELGSLFNELMTRGYGYIWGWDGQDWCDETPDNGNKRTLYLQRNYLKFGKSYYSSGIVLPALSEINGTDNIVLSFNWCWCMTGARKPDLTCLTVTVSGGGVIESTGCEISDEIVSTQPVENNETDLIWQNAEVHILGATSSTRITIRPTYSNPNIHNPERGQQRWYLDNIRVSSMK